MVPSKVNVAEKFANAVCRAHCGWSSCAIRAPNSAKMLSPLVGRRSRYSAAPPLSSA